MDYSAACNARAALAGFGAPTRRRRSDSDSMATLDGPLELAHQQRLRLRRELGEIIPQPLDRCLVHTGKRVPSGRKTHPPNIIKVRR